MNKLITKIVGVALGLSMAAGAGVAIANNTLSVEKANAANGEAVGDIITSYSGIRDGYTYKIQYTLSSTTYYLTTTITSNKGSCNSTEANAGLFLFESTGTTNQWYISFKNGNTKTYIKPNSSNATVSTSTSSTGMGVTAEAISSKIGLYVTYSSNKWYMAANSQNQTCGGYKSSSNQQYISGMKVAAVPTVLSSVTTSGQTTSFTHGQNFSYGGTLTAHYTGGKADANVTASATFKYASTNNINPTSTGTTITSSDTLSVDTHNGKYVYAIYTESNVTKWVCYQITVAYAAPTSVTLSSNSASVALEDTFDLSIVSITINPTSTADQSAYEWIIDDDGDLVEDEDYVWYNQQILSYSAGSIVFHCQSTVDNTKYAVFTLTISGDPIVVLKDGEDTILTNNSTTVFSDAGDIYFEVEAQNFDGEITYSWSSNNTSLISIDDGENTAACMFMVENIAGGPVRLSCRVQDEGTGDVTVYVDVTIVAPTVTSVTWNAPSIDVFSGTTLTSANTSSWNVKYNTNSGKTNQTPDSYNIKLGGSTISLPYTWLGSDNGKTLCVEYGGVSSSTTTVTITQTINSVLKPTTTEWTHTITSKTWSANNEVTINGKKWTADGDGEYWAYEGGDTSRGQQFGSGSSPYTSLTISSSDYSGTIDSVSVTTAAAKDSDATLIVRVGGTAYGTSKTLTTSNYSYVFDLGGKTGNIEIEWSQTTSKAIYLKGIAVNTVSGSSNIANNVSHKAAQRVAVKFANAFNTAMDTTNNCTTNMNTAWSTCTTAYNTFKTEAAALGETEEAYAKNLIKYATISESWPNEYPAEACIERMMRVYKICVKSHGMTAFMNELRPLGANANVGGVRFGSNGSNTITVVLITISVITATAVGGYFLLRKKKEER